MVAAHSAPAARIIGRYALYDSIASGGMATVHLGRLVGAVGFSRPVAIKRLHPQYAKDPDFAAMFIDEARLAARVQHPNVVPMLDVVSEDGEIFLVMEYVHGESLAYILRAVEAAGARLPENIVCNILANALHGLHAAHLALGEGGKPLGIVHRDMSPQNVLVGTDGVARVLDFGVAKAVGQLHTTREGQIKGKLRYMAPEQILGEDVGPFTDVWAASVMLWEALTGEALFTGANDAALLHAVLEKPIPSPREKNPAISTPLASLVLAGLARESADRLGSAREMAEQLEKIVGLVAARKVGAWVERAAKTRLDQRAKHMADLQTVAAAPTMAPVQTSVVQAKPEPTVRSRMRAAAGTALLIALVGSVWVARRPQPAASEPAVDARAASSVRAEPDRPRPAEIAAPTTTPIEATPAQVPTQDMPAESMPSRRQIAAPAPRKGAPAAPGSAPAAGHGAFKVPLYGRD